MAAGFAVGGATLAAAAATRRAWRQSSMRFRIIESAPNASRFCRSRVVGLNDTQLRCTSCAICVVVMLPPLR